MSVFSELNLRRLHLTRATIFTDDSLDSVHFFLVSVWIGMCTPVHTYAHTLNDLHGGGGGDCLREGWRA